MVGGNCVDAYHQWKDALRRGACSGPRANGGSLENPHERPVRRTAIIIAMLSLGTGALACRMYKGAPAGPAAGQARVVVYR